MPRASITSLSAAVSPTPVMPKKRIMPFSRSRSNAGITSSSTFRTLSAEPPQTSLDGFGDGLLDATELGGGQPHLGADDRVLRLQLLERAPEVLFRFAVAVLHRGVEIIDAGFERARDRPFLVRGLAAHHQPAHRPAAEAEDRDPQPGPAECPHFHGVSSFMP